MLKYLFNKIIIFIELLRTAMESANQPESRALCESDEVN
jgi:flagellar biosynthesis protein FliP